MSLKVKDKTRGGEGRTDRADGECGNVVLLPLDDLHRLGQSAAAGAAGNRSVALQGAHAVL